MLICRKRQKKREKERERVCISAAQLNILMYELCLLRIDLKYFSNVSTPSAYSSFTGALYEIFSDYVSRDK